MKKILVLLSTIILLATILVGVLPSTVDSKVITTLGNDGNPVEKTIILEGEVPPLIDATTYIDIPYGKNNVLPNSYFTVSAVDRGDGEFAVNPTVDVGVDGDIEWKYNGKGYGRFGHQEVFADDFIKKTLKYNSPGTNTDTKLKLPTEARVVDARVNVEGRLSEPSFKETTLALDTGLDQASYIATGDIDGDGNEDVVVTSQNAVSNKPDLVWYSNPSPPGGTDWTKNIVASNINYAFRVRVADLDSDGDQDIVLTSYYENTATSGVYWYENKDFNSVPGSGNGSLWEGGDNGHRIDYGAQVQYAKSLELGDLDNDGDIDVVVSQSNWNYKSVYIFENQDPDNATSWKRQTIYTETTNYYIGDISLGNLNHKQSSRLDIAVALYDWRGRVIWLENDGTPFNGAWTVHIIKDSSSTYLYYPVQVAVGDFNGDSKNDVVCAQMYSGSSYGTWWYTNPGDPKNTSAQWTRKLVYSGTYYPSDLVVGKINNDTDVDIVTTSSYEWNDNYQIHYLENSGIGNSFAHTQIDASLAGVRGIAVSNLDESSGGDTDLDILGAGFQASEVKWYRNSDGATPTFESLPVDEAGIADPMDVEVLDVDNDGDNDFLIAGSKSGDVQWYENPDNPFSSSWKSYNIDPSLAQAWQIALGDIDGDGDIDVAATSHVKWGWGSTSYGSVVWYEHPDGDVKSATSWTKHEVDKQANSPYGIDVADVDGDGDGDIIAVMEYDHKVRYYENKNGAGTTWATNDIATGVTNYPTGVEIADIDHDGDMDAAVVVGYDWSWGTNGVLWLEQPTNYTGGKWTKHKIDSALKSVKDLAIADIDDNGYPDVIVTTATSSGRGVYWYENPMNAGGTWNKHTIKLDSSQRQFGGSFISVSDIGNDGYLDVIASSGFKVNNQNYGHDAVYWFEEPDEPLSAQEWVQYEVIADNGINQPRGVFVADIDNAGLADIITVGAGLNEIRWHRVNMSYPRDVTMNVGGIGPVDFEYNGEVNVPKTTPNMALIFKEVLEDPGTANAVDEYGNTMSEIYLEVNSPVVGRVGINTVDIIYQYDAKVEVNSHNTFLYNELNEIIPDEGEGEMSVNIALTSQTPATMNIGNILINYNSPPTLEKNIPSDRHIKEGESVNGLFNLHNYFSDDIDEPSELLFRVEENSQAADIWVFVTDMKYVKVSATKNPDWSGTTEIVVSAVDTMGAKTLSNKFKITVDNANDPPAVGIPIPNFEILEGQTTYLMNIDDEPYFADIDSSRLYYRAVVDESYRNYLRVDFEDDNEMYATAIGDRHDTNIPVHIYADDKDLTGLTEDELEANEIVQDIFIDIINDNDGPIWLNFPSKIEIEEDYTITNGKAYRWLNLNDFALDIDNNEYELSYSVVKNTNSSYFKVTIDSQDWLYIDNSLVENFVGQSYIILRMTDGREYADIAFWVKTISINDKPTIQITSPESFITVSGETRIQGSAQDIEGLEKVMVRINDGGWDRVTGTNNWEFVWDTSGLADGEYLLSFKTYDNDPLDQKVSDTVQIRLNVRNVDNDPDNDGYYGEDDKFPYEASQWSDTDQDGFGDSSYGYNADQFPEDPAEWYDFDDDGYGNNVDEFPYDPTQWNDTDGDGFGDNLWGNHADLNIMDRETGAELPQTKESDGSGEKVVTSLWILVVVLLVAVVLVSYLFNRFYKPPAGA